MKFFLFVTFSILCSLSFADEINNRDLLERSVGRLVLHGDIVYLHQNGFDGFRYSPYLLFQEEYENYIKILPAEDRVLFFWATLWHLRLDGEYMESFIDLAYKDCGQIFIKKLEKFIDEEDSLAKQRTWRYELATKILYRMRQLQESN